jgi:hypothetical protein
VISRFVNGFDPCGRAGALVLFMLAAMASGCGSNQQSDTSKGTGTGGAAGADKPLAPEDMYRYEGTGKEKRKVELSRRERVQLRREAANKSN